MDNLQQPSVLAMPFANNGDKNVIPSAPTGTNKASLSEGFPQVTSESIAEGGIPPERADFNALGNIATMFYYFMQCGGAYTFRADVSSSIGGYPKGALLWYIPAIGIPNLLTSTINNNTRNFNTDQSVIGEAGSGKPWEIVTVSPTNFMDLISNQTAAGNKTFTGLTTFSQPITITTTGFGRFATQNTGLTKGTNPQSNIYGQWVFQDSSSLGSTGRIGGVEASYETDGDIITRLEAFEPVASSTNKVAVEVHYKADGTKYATCPTPPAGDSSNKIATTEWITNFATGYPDYASRVSKNADTDYTAEFDGFLFVHGMIGSGQRSITINGVSFMYVSAYGDGGAGSSSMFPVKAGDTFRADGANNFALYLIPLR